jgi:hypothetical protein
VTDTTARSPQPDGDWPAAAHRDLLDGLSTHLDADAGLREVMLHAHHAGLTGALGYLLDTQAGLAAILAPQSAEPSPDTRRQSELAAAITAADPAVRIALRQSPVTVAVILSDLHVRAQVIAGATDRAFASVLDLVRDRALDLVRDLDRAIHLGLAREFARTLGLDLVRDDALDLVRYLDVAIHLGLDLTHARDLYRARFVRDLAAARKAVHARALDLAHDLDVAHARAIDHAHETARGREAALIVGGALGLQQVEGLAAALLDGALDDFTSADLARADLTGHDLTGIRWSDWGTIWPPGTDTSELRARSQEIAPGIYQITRPGHDDKARHHTPA